MKRRKKKDSRAGGVTETTHQVMGARRKDVREGINVYLLIRTGRYKYIISFDLYHLPEGQKVQLKRQGMK